MIAKQRIWDIREYNKEKASCFAAELGISPLVTGILLERGLNSTQAMRDFLYGCRQPFHDPFMLKDMEKAAERIERALANGEQITVYGDYDVDGITASSLLYIYLRGRGARAATYIPKRKSEGYGLNDEALKTIAESGTTLVITVDCGISGLHEVENAPGELDIIITDHHTVPEVLPPAYAIVNPKQRDCGYPFKDLSGVGVAFKLCQALEQKIPGQLPEWQQLTELAALGTIADIVPLIGENRELVRRGLKAMETTALVGLKALMKVSGCPETGIAADNIGFGLAPRLNAVGRLEHAQSAVELLVTEDEAAASAIAAELNHENALRQEISRRIMEEAEAQLAQEQHIDTAIVLANEGWHQGVIGIAASRLVDKYHLPVVLLSIADGMAKGSCRSIPALNLYEAIAAESDLLTQFGGHHQAAGLTLSAANVPEFTRRFKEYVRQRLQPQDYQPHQVVDCLISGSGEITVRDLEELSLLEPCGCGNLPPVFAFQNALLHNQRTLGRERNHLQFTLDKNDYSYRCVMWNHASLLPLLFDNMIADVAFQPKINVWNNETSVQLHAVSLRQQVTLGDLRKSPEDKWQLLQSVLRLHDKINVIAEDAEYFEQKYCQGSTQYCRKYLELVEYKSAVEQQKFLPIAVLWDLPPCSLKELAAVLRAGGARNIILLFKEQEAHECWRKLRLRYPGREQMAEAYRLVMRILSEQDAVSLEQLLQQHENTLSEAAVKIMQELGFIKLENGIITKGIIQRCSLEDSALYVALQQERSRLELCYKENLQMSQYELLRG